MEIKSTDVSTELQKKVLINGNLDIAILRDYQKSLALIMKDWKIYKNTIK